MNDAREVFSAHETPPTDQQLFDVFSLLTVGFAAAATQPKMRAFMGISSGARLLSPSGAALLYPIAASVFASMNGESIDGAIGYGLANLGYVLLVAGLVAGTFRAFAIERRGQVLLAAAVAWILGIVLSNM